MLPRLLFAALLVTHCMPVLPASGPQATRDNRNVEIPSEALFKLELLSRISTATNKKGDKFNCRVLEPVGFSNAIISGEVTRIKTSGKVKGRSEISLSFGKIALPDGRVARFGAQAVEIQDINADKSGKADEEGSVRGKSTVKKDALKIAAGGIIGAIVGGIFGGSGGAAVGAAIGTAFGTTSVLTTSGPNLELEQGTTIIVRTDKRRNER